MESRGEKGFILPKVKVLSVNMNPFKNINQNFGQCPTTANLLVYRLNDFWSLRPPGDNKGHHVPITNIHSLSFILYRLFPH